MGIHNGSTKLQQYTEELWNEYTNDEDIVIRKSGNNLNAKPKKVKKLVIQQQPKKKVQPSSAKQEDSKDLVELKEFLEDNLAVGFGSLVPSTYKKRVRNRKQKAKKQTNQPINLEDELNKFDDGWETMLYRNNRRELNKMKRDIEKEEKIQKAIMLNKSFVRHGNNEPELKSPVKIKPNKESVKNTKMIKKQLDQQIELQKQKQQKKNEMEKWNQQKLQNGKKKPQQNRGKDSNFNSIIQEHQQMKEQIKVENSKARTNKTRPQSKEENIQQIVQKQVEQEKKQKEQNAIKANKELKKIQKEKKHEKMLKQQKHAQMVQKANNKGKK